MYSLYYSYSRLVPVLLAELTVTTMTSLREMFNWIITAILILAVFFLSFRIFLQLLGAEATSLFSAFIYTISAVFLLPFVGMLSNFNLPQDSVIDVVAIVGLIGYVATYAVVMAVLNIVFRVFRIGLNPPEQQPASIS